MVSVVKEGLAINPWAIDYSSEADQRAFALDLNAFPGSRPSSSFSSNDTTAFESARFEEINSTTAQAKLRFQLAPKGQITIKNKLWELNSHAFEFAFVRVSDRFSLGVSMQNNTHRVLVGVVRADFSESSSFVDRSTATATATATTSDAAQERERIIDEENGVDQYRFQIGRVYEVLENFNAISFSDASENEVGGDVELASVQFIARAVNETVLGNTGSVGVRSSLATTSTVNGFDLLPAFGAGDDVGSSNDTDSNGAGGNETAAQVTINKYDSNNNERAIYIGTSVAATLLLAVFVVICYFARKRMKRDRHPTDGSDIASEHRVQKWVDGLHRKFSSGDNARKFVRATTLDNARNASKYEETVLHIRRGDDDDGDDWQDIEVNNSARATFKTETNTETPSPTRATISTTKKMEIKIPETSHKLRRSFSSSRPPKSITPKSSSHSHTASSGRAELMNRLQLLRSDSENTTPAHSRENSRHNSDNAHAAVSVETLARELASFDSTNIVIDSLSSGSSSQLELSPDKNEAAAAAAAGEENVVVVVVEEEKEVSFENLTEEVLEQDVKFYERLGGGAYGNVYRGKFRDKDVALKTLRVNALPIASAASSTTPLTKENESESNDDIKMLRSEIAILRLAKHENVVSIFAACLQPIHKAMLVVQLVHGGSLNEMLHRENGESVKLSGKLLKTILLDVARAMEYLHGLTPHKILHRDLKPQNVLVEVKAALSSDDIKYKAYVCDFGISRLIPIITNSLKTNSPNGAGTANYMAPEMFTGNYSCSTKSDVFSYGNIVFECACGRIPFENCLAVRIAYLVGLQDKRSDIFPEDKIRSDVLILIEKCWKTVPDERPSFQEVCAILRDFPESQNFDSTTTD